MQAQIIQVSQRPLYEFPAGRLQIFLSVSLRANQIHLSSPNSLIKLASTGTTVFIRCQQIGTTTVFRYREIEQTTIIHYVANSLPISFNRIGDRLQTIQPPADLFAALARKGGVFEQLAQFPLLLSQFLHKFGRRGAKIVPPVGDLPIGIFVAACAFPDGKTLTAEGRCDGAIAFAPLGEGGFGYDPVFIPEGYDRTFAEMSADEKNAVSHRGRAVRKLSEYLSRYGAAKPPKG